MKNLIIQFAKWPKLGMVKTRLAKDLGDRRALEVHKALTREVSKNVSAVRNSDAIIAFDSFPQDYTKEDKSFQSSLSVSEFEHQYGEDLGEKMSNAIAKHLASHHKVLIVGSDCPSADVGYIEGALDELDRLDVVLGPATDGGYVLIGTRVSCPGIFAGIEWGGPKVMAATLQKIKEEGLTCSLLEPRWDVDELADYHRWCRKTGIIID